MIKYQFPRLKIRRVGIIEYAYAFSVFDRVISAFKEDGFELCSLEDIAQLKILGAEGQFEEGPIVTREGVICFPGDPPRAKLVKNSPILYSPDDIVLNMGIQEGPPFFINGIECFAGSSFYPTKEQITRALENSIDFPVQKEASSGIPISTEKFDSDKLAVFLFGGGDSRLAGEYGRTLRGSQNGTYVQSQDDTIHPGYGVKNIYVHPKFSGYINEHKAPFVEQIWYGRPSGEEFEIHLSSSQLFSNIEASQHFYGIKRKN